MLLLFYPFYFKWHKYGAFQFPMVPFLKMVGWLPLCDVKVLVHVKFVLKCTLNQVIKTFFMECPHKEHIFLLLIVSPAIGIAGP